MMASTGAKTSTCNSTPPEGFVSNIIRNLWSDDSGQDIAEYAVMVAVILIIVVGTIRLIGSNSNTVFSNVASSVQ
jgi:Flp pilus assembly pilin Flp